MNAAPSTNGTHVEQRDITQDLLGLLTEGYKAPFPEWAYGMGDGFWMAPVYLLRDIEIMRIHPVVMNALDYYKGSLAGVEFEGAKGLDGQPKPISENQELADFIVSQCRRFWDRGVPKLQNGYDFGWVGCENVYAEQQGGQRDGLLQWEGCVDFHPRDCFILTQDCWPIGVRVMNVVRPSEPRNPVDLWFAEGSVPAKALWYAHRRRFNRYYGQSQLLGAWRTWRRLAGKDAAETVLDGGFYRMAWSAPIIEYPEEVVQAPPGTTQAPADNNGNPIKDYRDLARQIGQYLKTGASVGIPSTNYPESAGGGKKWVINWDKTTFNGDPLINYINYLIKQIREGVGVPSELIEAAETGSGYSGRAIPLEGFLQKQQEIANAMLALFVQQVLRPLVLWNKDYFLQYGTLDFEVCVANLLETKLKAAMNPGGAAPGMRAGGGQGGEQPPGGAQGDAAMGITWSPFSGPEGQQGWKSTNGLIRYTQQPPGALEGELSLGGWGDRVRAVAAKIKAAVERAA